MHDARLIGDVPATRSASRRGFTVVELLVAMAILGVLVAVLLPAVQNARAASRRAGCQNKLKQHALALHNYESAHGRLPAGSYTLGPAFDVASGWGWAAMTLPMTESSALYDQIDFNRPTAVGENIRVIGSGRAIDVCPSDVAPETIRSVHPDGLVSPVTVAAGNYMGVEPMLASFSSYRLAEISDGLSQTLLLGEQVYGFDADTNESATCSWVGTITFSDQPITDSMPHQRVTEFTQINDIAASFRTFSSRHVGGANFAFADGRVRMLWNDTDLTVYRGLGSPQGNEAISF